MGLPHFPQNLEEVICAPHAPQNFALARDAEGAGTGGACTGCHDGFSGAPSGRALAFALTPAATLIARLPLAAPSPAETAPSESGGTAAASMNARISTATKLRT